MRRPNLKDSSERYNPAPGFSVADGVSCIATNAVFVEIDKNMELLCTLLYVENQSSGYRNISRLPG
jgi:hypothetical protein